MKQGQLNSDLSVFERRKQNVGKKQKIGIVAASMIEAGECKRQLCFKRSYD